MNAAQQIKPRIKHSTLVWRWVGIAAIATLLFGWVYVFEPLQGIEPADYWNDKITDGLLILAALAAAALSTRFARQFAPSEPPGQVWLWFSLGWWAWLLGELWGLVNDALYWSSTYPSFTAADVFWLTGYLCFSVSLYRQTGLISGKNKPSLPTWFFSLLALALLLTAGLTIWGRQAGLGQDIPWWALYLSTLYPVLDLFVGAAALWFFFLFGLGYLGRPWWGILLFTLADGLNIFFWMGGYERLPEPVYLALDTLSSMAYFAAYSLSALALLALQDHLKHGIIASSPLPGPPPVHPPEEA